jgi:hypothetical protein
VRLAVALLQDNNGVIDIALPVTGSLDDPQFRGSTVILPEPMFGTSQRRHFIGPTLPEG